MLDKLIEITKDECADFSDREAECSDNNHALQAAQGDTSSYDFLYRKHYRRTRSICLRIAGQESAEDLAQDAWIQVFRKIKSFRGDSAFTTWLHRLTVNTCLMHFRKRQVKCEFVTDDEEFPVVITPGSERPSRMQIIDSIALEEAFQYLAEGYRNVILYHDILGYEHEEVAVILKCSVGTSKSQLHKARTKLKWLLTRKNISSSRNNIVDAQYDKTLGIELPAINIGDWRRAIDDAEDTESESYEDFFED